MVGVTRLVGLYMYKKRVDAGTKLLGRVDRGRRPLYEAKALALHALL